MTAPMTKPEAAALDIIRTETVLSTAPGSQPGEAGECEHQILKTTPDGKIELKWILSLIATATASPANSRTSWTRL